MNPYVKMRHDAKRTQQFIADISDVQDQYIRKLELGLVNTPNRVVARTLLDILPSDYYKVVATEIRNLTGNYPIPDQNYRPTVDQTLDLIEAWYEVWQRDKRASVGRQLKQNGFEYPSVGLTPTDFRLWVMSFTVGEQGEPNTSVYEFCKTFALHPYTVEAWETPKSRRQRSTIPPATIYKAFAEAGIDLSKFKFVR